jgi:hypothetical protein
MTFADMSNVVLARTRQRGVNFGNSSNNAPTDLNPPYEVALALNNAYNEFLRAVLDYRIATIDVDFLTTANASLYSLNPLPNGAATLLIPTGIRPALMQFYEMRYCFGNTGAGNLAQERYIPAISSIEFRAFTGAYTQRYGAYAAYPRRVTQQYGLRAIAMFPGTATAGDTIKLFGCPDPQATESAYPGGQVACVSGGAMTKPTDVPLIPNEFHLALVYHATAFLCEQADKMTGAQTNHALYQQKIDEAQEFGAVTGEGVSEQRVMDPYLTAFDLDSSVL